MRKSILVCLALLAVGLLGVSVTVLVVNAQSNTQRNIANGSMNQSNCQNFVDADGDGICDHQGSEGQHMDGMHGTNMMQMHGNLTMQHAGNCGSANATP